MKTTKHTIGLWVFSLTYFKTLVDISEYSKNPLNRTSTGPDKMSGLERIPVYRGFSYLLIHRRNSVQIKFANPDYLQT